MAPPDVPYLVSMDIRYTKGTMEVGDVQHILTSNKYHHSTKGVV